MPRKSDTLTGLYQGFGTSSMITEDWGHTAPGVQDSRVRKKRLPQRVNRAKNPTALMIATERLTNLKLLPAFTFHGIALRSRRVRFF